MNYEAANFLTLETKPKANLFATAILWQDLGSLAAAIAILEEKNYGWHIRPQL